MLGLLVLLLAAAAVCGRLGVWQLDRAQARGDAEARAAAQEQVTGSVPLGSLLAPQAGFSGDLVGRAVTTTGVLEADRELLVPGRSHEGRTGVLVLTPLRVDEPGAPVLPVVRGWVPDLAAAAALDPAPGGTVAVRGYLQSGEAGTGEALAEGQVAAISPAELVNRWGGPIYSGYLVLAEVEPAQDPDLALLDRPTLPGGGLNVQNVAYALQWWVFGGFAVLLWVRTVRDEVTAEREDAADDDAAGDDAADDDADLAVSPAPGGAAAP